MLSWLPRLKIQSRLIAIFVVVFVAGIAATAWNAYNTNQAKKEVTSVARQSRADTLATIKENRQKIVESVKSGNQQVSDTLEQADELLYLQYIEASFRELDSVQKDYALIAYPEDSQDIVEYHAEVAADLEAVLQEALGYAFTDEVIEMLERLQEEVPQFEADFVELQQLVEEDWEEAQYYMVDLSLERFDRIYLPLSELVDEFWEGMFEDFDETTTQLETSLARTDTEMQAAIDHTTTQMDSLIDNTESELDTAVNVSLLTIGLFVVAGAVVITAIVIVARQIVRPVLSLATVAESIERDQFETGQLETSVDPLTRRQDEIGQLARVFQRMAHEVYVRVERLKEQVVQLQIVIDKDKRDQQVSEITESDFFQDLQAKAASLRSQKRTSRPAPESGSET